MDTNENSRRVDPRGAGGPEAGVGEQTVHAGITTIAGAVSDAIKGMDTDGSWRTEAESAKEFDRRALATGCFKLLGEVEGEYVQPKFNSERKDCRIDRILLPTSKLLSAGWPHGPIGVEIKKSGVKIGEPINQVIDYTRAAWHLETAGEREGWEKGRGYRGYHVMLEWFLIWPWGGTYGTVASMACQHRIAGAWIGWEQLLCFKTGNCNGFEAWPDGRIEAKGFRGGAKVGSR